MKCSTCGSEVPEGTMFCFNCGSKVGTNVVSQKLESKRQVSSKKGLNLFNNKHVDKLKKSGSNISKSAQNFIENAGNTVSNTLGGGSDELIFEKYSYGDALNYIRSHNSTKIAFPASDDKTKDKWNQLLSGEVIGTGAGLVGAAASIGLIGTTFGAGLIVIGAGALIGSVLSSQYEKMMWVPATLFIEDDELVISGKFSIHYDEIKHISTKIFEENELIVLTLKEQAIEFKTYNAEALKSVIDEKLNR